jgi:hypothetical protein
VNRGGTYCIPGPFGAGKTVLQQLVSRHAEVDIVIIAACGERAGEVVETLKTFPELQDPRTHKPLIDRTIIICNTSSMPVAARESSVYTAVTMAEYYRQMGLNVLLLADSTSRWAQAMREMSGRLEEIPGEEAFPAYLESRIASFYERAGCVRLQSGATGSVTIGGAVSPAGGNFEEPVTQATLKVVGAFHGLSRERSDARKYPAIDPLISWSKYAGFVDPQQREKCHNILVRSSEISQMMKVIGEEGTSLKDYIEYLKGEFFDFVYLQQNAFDPVDESTSKERQVYLLKFICVILDTQFSLEDKPAALHFFQSLSQLNRSIPTHYLHIDRDNPLSIVQAQAIRFLGMFSAIVAGFARGLDTRDIHNFLCPEIKTSYKPSLVGLAMTENDEAMDLQAGEAISGLISLLANVDQAEPPFLTPYHTFGVYDQADNGEVFSQLAMKSPLRLCTVQNYFGGIDTVLKTRLRMHAEEEKAVPQSRLQISSGEVTNSGVVL